MMDVINENDAYNAERTQSTSGSVPENTTQPVAQTSIPEKPKRLLILHIFNPKNNRGGITSVYDPTVGFLTIVFCHHADHYSRKTAVKVAKDLIDKAIHQVLTGAVNTNTQNPLLPRTFVFPLFDSYRSFRITSFRLMELLLKERLAENQISYEEYDDVSQQIQNAISAELKKLENIKFKGQETHHEKQVQKKSKTKDSSCKKKVPTPAEIAIFKRNSLIKKYNDQIAVAQKALNELTEAPA